MPFIGNQPALSYTSFAKQDFTTSATTSYTLDNSVANENEIALFINFVRQEPTTAYTASGTTLTLTSATSASDDMYCVFLGKAVQTVNPPNNSVGTAQLADDAVTKDKVSNLMYPAFEAYLSADQTGLTDNVYTKAQIDTEVFDTDGCYDNATNYRFTPTVAGKYYVYLQIKTQSSSEIIISSIASIYKNGTLYKETFGFYDSNNLLIFSPSVFAVVDMNGSTDYLEAYVKINTTGSTARVDAETKSSNFGAFRIGD
jgi:hypothetical protein